MELGLRERRHSKQQVQLERKLIYAMSPRGQEWSGMESKVQKKRTLGMVLSRAWQVQVGALDRTFWPLWGKSGAH